jgi:hypothetical protein
MDTYVLLAKGQRGLALVDLIQRVTADPSLFTFGELLDVQSIREVIHSVCAVSWNHFTGCLEAVTSVWYACRVSHGLYFI